MINRRRLISGVSLVLALIAWIAPVSSARATPSTQIWIPSTDVQPFETFHLNIDSYPRLQNEPNGTRRAPLFDLGPEVGILPFETIHAEVGFDLMYQGDGTLDKYPLYFNAKLASTEDSICKGFPAIAVGMYNIGIKPGVTTQDMGYGLVARTFPYIGRLSAGYFIGNPNVLIDENGNAANHGVLASWDRTMTEISKKLWMAIDYQGSQSSLGAVNAGVSWAFADNVSVIFGYDHYFNHAVAGRDTFTVQVDINF